MIGFYSQLVTKNSKKSLEMPSDRAFQLIRRQLKTPSIIKIIRNNNHYALKR